MKAIYPGSFDPVTSGHMDIIERVCPLVDELVVAVGLNLSKLSPLFTIDERMDLLKESCNHLPNVSVKSFNGLLVKYAREEGAQAIVRGLRAVSDFENEFQMAQMNRKLDDAIETLFVMTNWEHSYLSSSLIREVAAFGGCIKGLVPKPVEQKLLDKMKNSIARGR